MKKEEFKQQLKNFIERNGIKTASSMPEDSVVVVTAIEDFDPKSNDFWDIPGNRSYPREGLVCAECKRPVVMSGNMFEMYLKANSKPKVGCGKCIFGVKSLNELV